MPIYSTHERFMLRHYGAELLEETRYFTQRALNLLYGTRPVVMHRVHLHLVVVLLA